ncbi:hypothetical protein TB1_015836 [Malus domestica]
MNFSSIEPLSGGNFKKWKQDIEIVLGLMDLDLALREEEPEPLTDVSTAEQRLKHEKWEKANRMSLMVMKRTMSETVRGGIVVGDKAKDFLEAIGAKYRESEKAEMGNLMTTLTTLKFEENKSVREHILKLVETASKLKDLEVPVDDAFVVHMALNSLPSSFEQLKVSYNTQKEKWTLDDLISICAQEEARIKKNQMINHVNFMQTDVGKKPMYQHGKIPKPFNSYDTAMNASSSKGPEMSKKNMDNVKCYFCKRFGHMKKDCEKRKNWKVKKGISFVEIFVCFETNLVEVPPNSWWFDTGCSVHITNSLQGFTRGTTTTKNEVFQVYVGNGNKVAVEAIGSLKLKLSSGHVLELFDVLYVPSLRRNLISASKLVKSGYAFVGDNESIRISMKNNPNVVVGICFLVNDLWQLLCSIFSNSNCLNVDIFLPSKRLQSNESSAMLWHKRLGHISKVRMERLIKDNILPALDFGDLKDCIDCCKGKLTKVKKKSSIRSQKLLEVIHTDVCGPFPIKTLCGNIYFVTFIDDYSRFTYLYLIKDKTSVFECFKKFKTEVENQLDLSIKVLRSDRGGEYYGRYTEIGQAKGHLAVYLEQCGIQAQYTSPGTPQQNGVAERRNRTLIEMVRSMMSRAKLPQYLWGEALQMANYILNRVPTKAVSKTPYEVWIGRKPSLNHLHIWGCRAEARVYNPREKKLDSRTISCHFVGFPEKTKGYRFYSTDFPMRIFETGVAKFIEEGECSLEPDMEASRFNLEETGNVLPDNNIEWFDNGGTFGIQTTENDGGVINITQQQIEFNIDNFDHSMSGVGLDFHAVTSSQILGGLPGQQVRMENSEQPDIGTSSQPTRELIEPQATTERRILPARTRKSAISSDYVVYLQEIEMCEGMQDDPVTFYEAMETQQSNYWRDAMIDELRSMQTNNVWTLVEAPLNVKPIGCKWVFKTKRDLNGKVERYKARLVAKGFTQTEGIDYSETFSPVSTKDSLRIILSLVAHYDLELNQMDVKTAFLNGELEEEIYIQQPMGFVREGQENMVCKLNKSIYGLKQASRQWFMKFDQKVTAMGFIENKIDDCIYVKVCGSKFVFLILYVDDILLASNCMNMLLETKGLLSKTFEMKDMGNASFVLGIEIVRNRSKKLLGLSQKSYIENVLQRFNMQHCSNGEVPMGKGDRLNKSQCPKNELEKHGMSTKPYASLVGSLMYAQVCTRPDLAFAISVLGRYQANPGEQHWVAAKKVLRYLQRTKSYMLVYRSVENLELVGYTDSDFAGCLDDRKSTSGYVFTLGGAAVSWKSVKQKALATSTMEAEFIALFEATKKWLWLKNLITFMRLVDSISRPLVIHCDNKAAVFFSKNNKKSEATRLMDVKYLSVKEHVKKGDILVEHIDTQRMIADPLTKPLAVGVFKEHITSMGFHESFDSAGLWE